MEKAHRPTMESTQNARQPRHQQRALFGTRSFRFGYLNINDLFFFQFYRLIWLHKRLIWLHDNLNLVTRLFRFDYPNLNDFFFQNLVHDRLDLTKQFFLILLVHDHLYLFT